MNGSIALFFGTRPQIIKASVLREALATVAPVVAVDTGQHYDYALHQVHLDQLGVRAPDACLGVGSGSHAVQTGAILAACEGWIEKHRPELAVVIGDTNSTLACALAAAKSRVPVAHVEAGVRALDRLLAEEVNRRATDAVSQFLFAPCERAASVLRCESPDATVDVSGDVAYDVLRRVLTRLPKLEEIRGYDAAWGGDFVYATLHRSELVDLPARLAPVMRALDALDLPCLFSAHPRTAAALERLGVQARGTLHVTEPLGYLESLAVTRQAAVVVTDSGGLQREAYWLGRPCITVRSETEWLETLECGANRLVPPEQADRLPGAVVAAARSAGRGWDRTAYGNGNAASRVADVLRTQGPAKSSR